MTTEQAFDAIDSKADEFAAKFGAKFDREDFRLWVRLFYLEVERSVKEKMLAKFSGHKAVYGEAVL